MPILPPGINETDFSAALGQFAETVGTNWVFTSDEDVALYRDAYSPFWGSDEERLASAAVAPESVEEVQQIVRIANRYRIPLYPISTGKNYGYGGSAPVHSGSVVVDLKRMNRVLEIDERNATCLVEPGVSYFDLYNAIQEKGAKLWIDCPDPGWGSPIGNALDHGLGYTIGHFRDHFGSHCGMEVVLPNGEVLRTGPGGVPGSKTWQQYQYAFGPQLDGIFSQSNFGIVTKMGFWLAPEPEAFREDTVAVYNHDDLIPLVDVTSYLTNSSISNGLPGLGSPLLQAIGTSWGGPDSDPEHIALLQTSDRPALERYGREKNIPYWTCNIKTYGPKEVINAQWAHAREKFASSIPGATFTEGEKLEFPLTYEQGEEYQQGRIAGGRVDFGIPNLSIFQIISRTPWNPNPKFGHYYFSPIIPKTGEAIFEASRVFTEAHDQLGLPRPPQGITSLPALYYQRSAMLLMALQVTRNIEVDRKNRLAFKELVKIAAEHGWGEYRTPPAFQDDVMNAYSFGNNALRRFNETIKDAIDPNGIISPGKSGIWPKNMRGA